MVLRWTFFVGVVFLVTIGQVTRRGLRYLHSSPIKSHLISYRRSGYAQGTALSTFGDFFVGGYLEEKSIGGDADVLT